MEISERTVSALGEIITGDSGISPYRSGPKLVTLFNEYGANDVYKKGFPSRWKYAEDKILEEDYDGAITNARSLVEAVLTDIESNFDSNPPSYDDDLLKLY